MDAAPHRDLSFNFPHYAECPPGPALARWVACYWTITGGDAGDAAVPMRILPDGCSDLIIDLRNGGPPSMIGVMRHASVVTLRGAVDLFGIRFRPGAALRFVGVPMHELADRIVPLDVLWGRLASSLLDEISAAAQDRRAAIADAVLTRRLSTAHRHEALARRAASFLHRSASTVTVRSAATALGVNERTLERAFDQSVGVSPKELARVLRLRRAVRLVERDMLAAGTPRWTDVAYATGYADQPHLIREFKTLAGLTPAEYAAEFQRVGFVQYGEQRIE